MGFGINELYDPPKEEVKDPRREPNPYPGDPSHMQNDTTEQARRQRRQMFNQAMGKEPSELTETEIVLLEREIRKFVKRSGERTSDRPGPGQNGQTSISKERVVIKPGFRKGISDADKKYCQGILKKLNEATGFVRDLEAPTWCVQILP